MVRLKFSANKLVVTGLAWACGAGIALAQAPGAMPLKDLSSFKAPGESWKVVGDVSADLKKANQLRTSEGTGVLVNEPGRRRKGADLYTNFEHGDMDLELDYMMAKGANSGVYLQGRYEVQLNDSWGTKKATSADNGGIYERWDEKTQKGFEGYAPRQNVSRAPGLWQHLKVSFQAPRFDASGKKIANAKILRMELNGVTIHENVELFGPTRGAIGNNEVASGPLRIQGDHGAVAIKDIKITNYNKPRPELNNLKYTVYKGRFEQEPDFTSLSPATEGNVAQLTSDLKQLPKDFLIRYTGTLHVKEPGEYTFNLNTAGGKGLMKVNNKLIVPADSRNQRGTITLPAGNVPVELLYAKMVEWGKPAVGLTVEGPGIREFQIGDAAAHINLREREPAGPILVDAPVNTILRSFMDIPSQDGKGRGTRVVHAVNVGSDEQVHYTYDQDNGNIVQVWRGGFLDATPMWYSRGNGSSRPVGAVQYFGDPAFTIAKLTSDKASWVSDTAGTGFRPKGYELDEQDQPTFIYQVYGTTVQDQVRALPGGEGINRQITVQNPGPNLYARLAQGSSIEAISKDTYLIDGKSYYLRMEDAGGAKPMVRDSNGRKELIVPVQGNKLNYSILF
ncbi:PA14 domain-containing protein [Pontibacter ummariensis]|uniref:PA14 domain-containing protein n=1 Tax=Pontibacter ummariensis TaxID=1610492 RepID=A0A239G495_9BACT|nr:family 16 glycoside hydrolase [Pontibacter ummariensis]PRY11662.1 PA14 domain-containing protein [Pontibacter ummariensis]SNS63442.1 PA14 domain-containing protein [Pontibacter ummariensis]